MRKRNSHGLDDDEWRRVPVCSRLRRLPVDESLRGCQGAPEKRQNEDKTGKGNLLSFFFFTWGFNFYSESRRPSDVCLGTISRSESPPWLPDSLPSAPASPDVRLWNRRVLNGTGGRWGPWQFGEIATIISLFATADASQGGTESRPVLPRARLPRERSDSSLN